MGQAKASASITAAVREDGHLTKDLAEINEAFAAYFRKLGNEPGEPGLFDDAFLQTVQAQLDALTAVAGEVGTIHEETNVDPDVVEVTMAIRRLASGKACGPDGIEAELLKLGGARVARTLTQLIRQVWRDEAVPTDGQQGIIVPLYKDGARTDPANYRGITLLSIVGKVLCSVVLGRLQTIVDPSPGAQLDGTKTLVPEQAGFRRSRGCIEHAFVLATVMGNAKIDGTPLFLAFLDIKKAYDRVWRSGLWVKLHEHGVRGKLWRVVRAIYSDVRSAVRTNQDRSQYFTVNVGLRQGCVLSPVLFDVYVNDVVTELRNAGVGIQPANQVLVSLLYADDIALLASSEAELRRALQVVLDFCRRWRLELQPAKSKVMVLNGQFSQPIMIAGRPLERVNVFRYLGVELNVDGTWTDAVNQRVEAAKASTRNMMQVLKNGSLSPSARMNIWNIKARSGMDYAAELMVPTKDQAIELDRAVWAAARTVMSVCQATPVAALEADLGLWSYTDRADVLKLRWRVRLALADHTSPQRLTWAESMARPEDKRTPLIRYIQSLETELNLGDRLKALEDGDRNGAHTILADIEAGIAARRWARIQQAVAASVKLQERFTRVLGPAQKKPVAQSYLRDAASAPQARLRLLFRGGCVGLAIETGRHRGDARADRLCLFCTAKAVEDGTHFLVECPAWGRQRARMVEYLRGELDGLRGGMGALGTTWADWWISLSREAQADLLAGGQVALADKWSRADSSKIVAAMLVAFNRYVWQMWQARKCRSEAMLPGVGGAAAPMNVIFNNMPPQAVGADGQLGAE